MANKTLHSLQFPGLSDVYKVPEEAQEFSSSSTYAVGQFVTYQGVLYKCTTAVTTAGSWTGSTNWSVTDVGTELQVMQSNYYTKNYIDTYMAPLDTPTFTGVPKAPTATAGTNTTQIATTAFVEQAKNTRVPVYGLGKNLLRNWYFGNPVNQRGQTSYTGGTYSIDAWNRSVIAGSEVTVASGYVTFGPANASNSSSMQQKLEPDTTKRLQAGCTVTSSLLLNDGTLCYGSLTLSAGTTASNVFVTTIDGTEFRVSVGGNRDNFNIVRTGSKVNIVAVKLELGSQQTLCHQENGVWVLNEIPDYEEELIKCQTSTADSTDTYANKSLATEQQLAYVENGTTASRAYSAGEYFCWNGLLYQAKTAISSGAGFTVGTNCVATTASIFKTAKWTPINASVQPATSARNNYIRMGGLLIINICINLSDALADMSSVTILDSVSSMAGVNVIPSEVVTLPAAALQGGNPDIICRVTYNSNELSIENRSGSSIATTRIIYGQIVLGVV